MFRVFGCVAALVCLAAGSAGGDEVRLRVWLDTPGGDLPFELSVVDDRAVIRNGVERIEIDGVRWSDDSDGFVVPFEHYDSELMLRRSGEGMYSGTFIKMRGGDNTARVVAHARQIGSLGSPEARFDPIPESAGEGGFAGRWRVAFESSEDPAVGVFEVDDDGGARGTFLTTTGDYRHLAGRVDGQMLRLSTFDGAHAFLFRATMRDDGGLSGDFWSGNWWHETWSAERDDDAALPDGFGVSVWNADAAAGLRFPDTAGIERAVDDPALRGEVTILDVFGTWCPNCADATDLLVEYERVYGARGLRVIGLAFELTDDFERSVRQVERHQRRHGAAWPVLIVGAADKKLAGRAFPALDRVRSYPTLIFLDREGRVRGVHTGFSGPATGGAHRAMRDRFESLIDELLGEAD